MTDAGATTPPPSPPVQDHSDSQDLALTRALYQVVRDLSSLLTHDEVLDCATRSLVEVLGVSHAGVVLYDAVTGLGEVVAEFPAVGGKGTKIDRRTNPPLTRMETDLDPIAVYDVSTSGDVLGDVQAALMAIGIKSMLLVPIVTNGKLIGSLGIDVMDGNRHFSTFEIDGIRAVAAQLSISIRSAQLFEETQRRAVQFERIANLGRRIMGTLDRESILRAAAEEIGQMIAYDAMSVSLHLPNDPSLILNLVPPVEGSLVLVEFPFQETALRFVCNSAESLVLNDISQSDYPDYKVLVHHAPLDSWDSSLMLHSALIVPLQVGGRIIGTLNLTHQQVGLYQKSDITLVEQVANQLAMALENARLFAQAASRVQSEQLLNRLSAGLQQGDLQTMVVNTTREIGLALNARKGRIRLQVSGLDDTDIDMTKLRKMLDGRLNSARQDSANGEGNSSTTTRYTDGVGSA